MITVSSILGNIFLDSVWKEKFEAIQQEKSIETIKLFRSELEKTRLRKKTNKGTDIGIVLDSSTKIRNGDVLLEDSKKFITVEQMPEKVISVRLKDKIESDLDWVLVYLGHIIGNRHRPIQIKGNEIYFPVLSDSELDVFKKLFSSIINFINIKIEERIFNSDGEMDVHGH